MLAITITLAQCWQSLALKALQLMLTLAFIGDSIMDNRAMGPNNDLRHVTLVRQQQQTTISRQGEIIKSTDSADLRVFYDPSAVTTQQNTQQHQRIHIGPKKSIISFFAVVYSKGPALRFVRSTR